MEILEIKTLEQLELCYPVLKELRTELSFKDFTSLYEEAKKRDSYKLVGIFKNSRCIAVMGYRLLFDFVHGKHLYVDDLVVTLSVRSTGIGRTLLQYAEKSAKELGCKGLRLCTGVNNDQGKNFYERNGWQAKAIAYKKMVIS